MSADGTTTQQLVVFSLGAEEYALPIEAVHEIIRYTEPRSVASSVGWIRGVISLRGKIVPVYDLAARLGHGSAVQRDDQKIVIVETSTDKAGVVVDDVQEVLTIDPDQLEPVPSADGGSIEAIAKVDDRLIVLLNAAGLFGHATETAPLA
jgi:purine-binding chemotaxis protein CheW